MGALSGKTALVTGASRGIGRAIAERLASDGALVAVHYGSNEAAAKDTVAAIRQAGGQAFPVRAELGVVGDIDALFDGLEKGLARGRGFDPVPPIVVPKPVIEPSCIETRFDCRLFDANEPEWTGTARFWSERSDYQSRWGTTEDRSQPELSRPTSR
jgi:NAD(P)-dependent dehydrogenase (short-subunit alcohol dehydrogenase family)